LVATKKELFESFLDFDRKVFEPGVIPLKYKELIAVGAAHAVRLPRLTGKYSRTQSVAWEV